MLIRFILILALVISNQAHSSIAPIQMEPKSSIVEFTTLAPLRVPDRYVSWGVFRKKSTDEKSLMRWLTKGPRWYQNKLVIPVELSKKFKGWAEGTEFLVPVESIKRTTGLKLGIREQVLGSRFIPEKNEMDDEFSYLNIRKITLKKQMCGPMSKDILRWIKTEAIFQHVPYELLFALQKVETQGDCQAYRKESDTTASIGLFQINTGSTKIKACTTKQKIALKKVKSLKGLMSKNLNCLENPRVNTIEAISILKSKFKSVNGVLPTHKSWAEMNMDEIMQWQKAVSAYNGGQSYVIQAKKEISKFNNNYEAEFNTDDWGIRQAFMIRALIEKDTHHAKKVKSVLYSRKANYTLINLAYVEKVSQIASAINN